MKSTITPPLPLPYCACALETFFKIHPIEIYDAEEEKDSAMEQPCPRHENFVKLLLRVKSDRVSGDSEKPLSAASHSNTVLKDPIAVLMD